MFGLILPAQANFKDIFNKSLNIAAQESGHGEGGLAAAQKSIPEIIGLAIQALLVLLGVIFLGLIIYAGFTWMLARGNEQEVNKAKGVMQNAVLGLILVLAAYAITAFIGSALT